MRAPLRHTRPAQEAPWVDEFNYTVLNSYMDHVGTFGIASTTFSKFVLERPVTFTTNGITVDAKLTWRWWITGKQMPHMKRWDLKFGTQLFAKGENDSTGATGTYIIGPKEPSPIHGDVNFARQVCSLTGPEWRIGDYISTLDLTAAYQNPVNCVLLCYNADIIARSTLGNYNGY